MVQPSYAKDVRFLKSRINQLPGYYQIDAITIVTAFEKKGWLSQKQQLLLDKYVEKLREKKQ